MEINKKTYRNCVVPMCPNNSKIAPDKVYFLIPRNAHIRNKWCKAMKREKGSCLSSLYCCEDHFNIEQDTQNYMQYKIMTLEHRQRVTLHLKKGIVPYKFQCQKKDKSQAPPEREFALKRKRQALVEEALAEANQSKPGAETLGSSKPKINILQKPSSNTTVNTVENVYTPEQGGRAGSDASMQTLSNFNEQAPKPLVRTKGELIYCGNHQGIPL